jgi:hypothetical protein
VVMRDPCERSPDLGRRIDHRAEVDAIVPRRRVDRQDRDLAFQDRWLERRRRLQPAPRGSRHAAPPPAPARETAPHRARSHPRGRGSCRRTSRCGRAKRGSCP